MDIKRHENFSHHMLACLRTEDAGSVTPGADAVDVFVVVVFVVEVLVVVVDVLVVVALVLVVFVVVVVVVAASAPDAARAKTADWVKDTMADWVDC